MIIEENSKYVFCLDVINFYLIVYNVTIFKEIIANSNEIYFHTLNFYRFTLPSIFICRVALQNLSAKNDKCSDGKAWLNESSSI